MDYSKDSPTLLPPQLTVSTKQWDLIKFTMPIGFLRAFLYDFKSLWSVLRTQYENTAYSDGMTDCILLNQHNRYNPITPTKLLAPRLSDTISGLYVLLTGRLFMLETQSPPKTNDARKTVHSNTDNEGKLDTLR